MSKPRPTIALLYHFFHPDDVVSARHYSQLAEGLERRGWKVTAFTSNRRCHHPKQFLPTGREVWQSIDIIRVWRPPWPQSNPIFRLANSLWMILAWLCTLARREKYDVILVGTDPPFSALILPWLRCLHRKSKLVHWTFDLYPEAIEASSGGKLLSILCQPVYFLTKWSYKYLDLLVALSPCMKNRLDRYNLSCQITTVTPWAIIEPESTEEIDVSTRNQLFGKNANLCLLYSGNLGRAHSYKLFLKLARNLKERGDIAFTFAGRGKQFDNLRDELGPSDTNTVLAGFAPEEELAKRLNSADFHLISLKSGWSGIVVPSKFLGSLVVGKPILFSGPSSSSLSQWIEKYNLGFTLNTKNIEQVAEKLLEFTHNPKLIDDYSQRARKVYFEKFSRELMIDKMSQKLLGLLA